MRRVSPGMFRATGAQLTAWPPPFGWFARRQLARLLRQLLRRAGREQCIRQIRFRPYWMEPLAPIGERDLRPLHPRRRRRTGPMEIWELYQWHLARGTLWKFERMFPPQR